MALKDVRLFGRLGKFTWRMLAMVLVGQAISISLGALVARGIGMAEGNDRADTFLYAGLALSVLCIVTAGLMRTPLGLPLGWVCQLLTFLTAYIVPMMFAVGLLFLGLWVLCLVQGAKAERLVAEREAAAAVD